MIQSWRNHGIVVDVFKRSGDAEFILDADFEEDEGICVADLEWHECDIPASAFEIGDSLEQLLVRMVGQNENRLSAEHARCQEIQAWVDSCGGVEEAMKASPALVTINKGAIKLEDGWHRLGVAVFIYGASSIRALCADLDGARKVNVVRPSIGQ